MADQLGTPRMVFDKTGSLAATKRHDYLPFGEELFAEVGGRTTVLGYTTDNTADTIRQKFTSKERDIETGLDYFLARYYSSIQGRFTSDGFSGGPDELFDFTQSAAANPTFYADLAEPQSLNKYQYVYNNPLVFIDPDGHWVPPGARAQSQKTITQRLKEGAREVARVAKETVTGAASAILENNGFPGIDAPQNVVGRSIGDAASLVQGGMEVIQGVGMITGGATEAGITSPACPTGVGCALPAAGAVTAVAGGALTLHGGLVLGNTVNNIFSKNTSGEATDSGLGRSATTKTSGNQGQNTTTTVTDPAGSTTYKTTPGKTGGQSTIIVRKDAQGNVKYVKQEARHKTRDFNRRPDHVHYKKPKDKEVY